jgi:hypothetical protein
LAVWRLPPSAWLWIAGSAWRTTTISTLSHITCPCAHFDWRKPYMWFGREMELLSYRTLLKFHFICQLKCGAKWVVSWAEFNSLSLDSLVVCRTLHRTYHKVEDAPLVHYEAISLGNVANGKLQYKAGQYDDGYYCWYLEYGSKSGVLDNSHCKNEYEFFCAGDLDLNNQAFFIPTRVFYCHEYVRII